MAILDAEEFIFIDSQYKSWVEIAWRRFQPSQRSALSDPAPFEVCYHQPDGPERMRRLQGEFNQALQHVAAKQKVSGTAKVLKLQARRWAHD
ncbi:MAG: hypothetical protein ACK4TK_12735 [Thiobacillaceae bacterium]